METITFDNVTKRFGDVTAVDAVSLEVQAAELFFLLGPSGCGKTTLLRCVAGFWQPETGRIRFGDRDMTGVPPHERNTGMVFQDYALWPHMTVSENVAFGLRVRKIERRERRRRVEQALDMVRMGRFASRRPGQLSGGERQRIALARALVIEPQCVLLDEPLSNLDAKLRLGMRGEIRRICKEAGLTAIYVTHDQKEALSIADRIAVMNAGRIEQLGTPQELYTRPARRFVADFLGDTNFIDGRLTACSEGSAEVETAFGTITSDVPPLHRSVGDSVVLSIRPESIHMGAVPDGAPNALTGELDHTVYLGEVAQHEVAFDQGRRLKVVELNPKVQRTGDIACHVDPADVVILDD